MSTEMVYVGFWHRTAAALVDTLLYAVIAVPILYYIYGFSYFTDGGAPRGPQGLILAWLAPALVYVWFWVTYGQTPGKAVIGAKIVDAKTGNPISTRQAMLRYAGFFIGTVPVCIGILWIAISPKKQGWHDLMAGTAVVRSKRRHF